MGMTKILLFFLTIYWVLYRLGYAESFRSPHWKSFVEEKYDEAEYHVSRGSTVVFYAGSIQCETQRPFCALAYYVARESLTHHKYLSYSSLQCTYTSWLYHTVMVIFERTEQMNFQSFFGKEPDEPLVNGTHEPYAYIFHNCEGPNTVSLSAFTLSEIEDTNDQSVYQWLSNPDFLSLSHFNRKFEEDYYKVLGYSKDTATTAFFAKRNISEYAYVFDDWMHMDF